MYNHPAIIPATEEFVEGYDIRTLFSKSPTAGEVGLEIECEGNKFPKMQSALPKAWKYEHDGSLRGEDNAEYIFQSPLPFEEVPEAVTTLFETLKNYGTVLDESNRTSVHVHLNVQTFHLNRLTAFLGLYFAVEEVLTEWCGDHRVGNLFCLRAKDAPAIISKLKRFIRSNGKAELSDGLHYSGLNANAIVKFGSIEIRSLRGVTDPETIITWVGVLERIYRLSEEYETDPRRVTNNFSGGGPLDFLRSILGPYYDVIREGIPQNDHELVAILYDGIRLAQDLCYCRDWSKFKKADISKDPFGRNSAKISSATLAQYVSEISTISHAFLNEPIYPPVGATNVSPHIEF